MLENNQIPLVYYQCVQKLVTVRKKQYVFTIRHNISLAYIDLEYVDDILNIRGGCCGNKKPGVFRNASEQEIRIWNGEADR